MIQDAEEDNTYMFAILFMLRYRYCSWLLGYILLLAYRRRGITRYFATLLL